MAEKQVKSRQRVADHGEVFTAEREVRAMCDLVKSETERIESRFLEPACGNGNFLAEVLRRKLAVVKSRYGKNPSDYERYSVLAVTSIYGVDILADNAQECRERLFALWNEEYTAVVKSAANPQCREAVRYILQKNILCGDALTMKQSDGSPIVFAEWSFPTGNFIKRRDYRLDVLLKENTDNDAYSDQLSLFADEPDGTENWMIFMLRNLSSPETYFQAAFRVQSPWEVTTDKGQKEIIKKECYVFDFALNRALRQISDYSCRLNIHEGNPEKKVAEFINFLPVIAYDGSSMQQINAGDILDIAMAGTSATLLAKRWESVLLVNVDNETLSRLIANKDAMDALMKIEGFRSLNSDIETIIAKSEKVKKAKKKGTKDLTPKQKKELSDEEKEYKSKRKQIQEKLIKFATRIPVFMYLTDYRERCLKDVITQLEPGLFKKVTGLSVKDFELLVSLGVFNDSLMNDAVYKFKRYEDASLSYTGINRHDGEDRGGWDTVLSDADYNKMFTLQQASMEAPAPAPDDLPAKPYFTPDEDEPKPAPAKKPAPQPAKPIISYGGFTPKTNTAQNTQASGSKIHKPSNSYTPRPVSGTPGNFTPRPAGSSVGIGVAKPSFGLNSQPAAQPKPPVKVDVSKIKVGVKVKHKAFGVGTVAAIQPDMVTVRFGSVEKKFLLPAAIVQGYLMLI